MMNYLNARLFRFFLSALFYVALLMPFSCTHDEVAFDASENAAELERVANKLKAAGFDTSEGFMKYKDGYLVEYDIFLTEKMIDECVANHKTPSNGRTQHYVTNNLVNVSGTRTLQIFLAPGFTAYMQSAFNAALNRYNNLNSRLRFQRAQSQSNADISVVPFYENSGILGYSSGFPSGGNPANTISLNTYHFNSNRTDAITVIAHEIGHAIGFRHTDYMNRAFSCGIGGDEGDAGYGANHVAGTPTAPSANSWMLACSNGSDRPFTQEDITALQATYPPISQTWYFRIAAAPSSFISSYCTYKFGAAWTACAGTGTSGAATDGVLVINGLGFNPTQCAWNALYGPATCSYPFPGSPGPSPITRSFSLSPASGSGVQYVPLTFGNTSVTLTVQYVYNP